MFNQNVLNKSQEAVYMNGKPLNKLSVNMRKNGKAAICIRKNKDVILHSLMCSIGGLLGGYAVLCRGNLGSAQTLNLIEIVLGIAGRNRGDLLIRIVALSLYLAGIEGTLILSKKTCINIQRYSIVVDMAGFIILAALPDNISSMAGLLPMFFMLSTQWSVFHGTRGYNSSTIFSTNNFRQAARSFGEYAISRDREQLKMALFFLNSLFWFHINVAASYLLVKEFGVQACLFGFIYAVLAFIITFIKDENC